MAEVKDSAVAEAVQEPGISRIVTHVLTGLLIADLAGAAARLAVPPHLSHSDSAWRIAIDVKPIVVLSRVLFAATVIVFLIWFFQARDNAAWSSWRQRRARAWAFWGWVVPIADLWIPFQMMGDIWRAHLLPSQRHKTAWLPVIWWTSWLVTGLLKSSSGVGYGLELAHSWSSFFFFAVAGISLIAIIQTVSRRPISTNDGCLANC